MAAMARHEPDTLHFRTECESRYAELLNQMTAFDDQL